PRPEYPSPTPCQSLRHSVAAELFTIQSFSPACPIALYIPFENWKSSLRIYRWCSFSFLVSSRDAVTCGDGWFLTRCHLLCVSKSCHFFIATTRGDEPLGSSE